MAILNPAIDYQFLEGINLFGNELLQAIKIAQITAEGLQGARRSLETRAYTETHTINRSMQGFYPAKLPILTDPAPIIKVCTESRKDFGRSVNRSEWVTLTPYQYSIDPYLGEVRLLHNGLGWSGRYFDRAQITYSSGFDFDEETDDTLTIKQAVASILKYQNPQALPEAQAAAVSGVKQFALTNVYSVTYADSADARYRDSLLTSSLQALHKYRPREVSV